MADENNWWPVRHSFVSNDIDVLVTTMFLQQTDITSILLSTEKWGGASVV